jgi:23S rRNA (cytidine1920-2'-O)/16S rRNA (cytidine1409-2'-O)-methyltransferase
LNLIQEFLMASRIRLDLWLVEQGYFSSRQQAQRAIQAGEVYINGVLVDKPGTQVSGSLLVTLQTKPTYVSRGGEKLAGALLKFPIRVRDRICLDGGISTGGFTDCLLQHGAQRVYGIDVGYGQLAWSLRTDPRVILRERTNLRYLAPEDLYPSDLAREEWPDLATVDLSFISLQKVLASLWRLLQEPRESLLLVKPQFEAGRQQVGKKGVVRDPEIHAQVITQVLETALQTGWQLHGMTWSPVLGPAGNIEYWLWMSETASCLSSVDLLSFCQEAREVLTP